MSLAQVHLEIARERFLELMAAAPAGAPTSAAVSAIEQATEFVTAYRNWTVIETPEAPRKLKGCKQCFGSGGKINAPCRSCGGSGKVAS